MIYQMCINNFKTKHQCLIFGHSSFTFSKMISWKLSCCVIVWTQIHMQTHTHVCAKSHQADMGDGASPHTRLSSQGCFHRRLSSYEGSHHRQHPCSYWQGSEYYSIFCKNILCWNIVERLQWAISKKRVLWRSKKVLSKMLLYCDSAWFLILIKFRSMGLTAQGLSEWRWESLF